LNLNTRQGSAVMSHAVWLSGATGIIQLLVIFYSKAPANALLKKMKFQQRTSFYTQQYEYTIRAQTNGVP